MKYRTLQYNVVVTTMLDCPVLYVWKLIVENDRSLRLHRVPSGPFDRNGSADCFTELSNDPKSSVAFDCCLLVRIRILKRR